MRRALHTIDRLARVARFGFAGGVPAPDAPSAPTATLNGLNTVDLSVTPPSLATGVYFYGTSDDGTQYASGNTSGTINTSTLANGVWTFAAAAWNAGGNSANSSNSTPVIRVLPNACVTSFLTAGVGCYQGRGNLAVPAVADNDPVGTWVDRATSRQWVAPDDASRPTLKVIGANKAISFDGVDDRLAANNAVNFAGTAFTISIGVTPNANTAGSFRDVIGNSTTNGFVVGHHQNGNMGIARQGINATPLASTQLLTTLNSVASWWSATGALAAATTANGRVNGGSTSGNTLNYAESRNNVSIGGEAGKYAGYIWCVLYATADLSGGTGLAALEGETRNHTPA